MSASSTTVHARRTRRPGVLLSPLRYPGGKRRLAPFVAEALRLNGLRPRLYVEPFAGGASVALQLLHNNLVDQVVLGEKDPLLAGFWHTVFRDHQRLIARLRTLEASLEQWEYYRRMRPRTALGWALKCLFLNRTSFSGILSETAGPIGGRQQRSAHLIGCRFPVERLVSRIEQIAAYADRVAFVWEGDWRAVLQQAQRLGVPSADMLCYFDPPFYQKADRLYRYSFAEQDHERLYEAIVCFESPYMLSYDAAPPIVAKYSACEPRPRQVELLYSATARGKLVRASELIVSNLLRLPEHTQLWQTERQVGPEAAAEAIAA